MPPHVIPLFGNVMDFYALVRRGRKCSTCHLTEPTYEGEEEPSFRHLSCDVMSLDLWMDGPVRANLCDVLLKRKPHIRHSTLREIAFFKPRRSYYHYHVRP